MVEISYTDNNIFDHSDQPKKEFLDELTYPELEKGINEGTLDTNIHSLRKLHEKAVKFFSIIIEGAERQKDFDKKEEYEEKLAIHKKALENSDFYQGEIDFCKIKVQELQSKIDIGNEVVNDTKGFFTDAMKTKVQEELKKHQQFLPNWEKTLATLESIRDQSHSTPIKDLPITTIVLNTNQN